ncbi:MAG: hypothetical protein ABIR15_19610 [Chitinophagaceae bacterium]
MKRLIPIITSIVVFISCKNEPAKIVDRAFSDSLIAHYNLPASVKATEDEIVFWKNRIDPQSTGLVNESRYASSLISRFHQFGDIQDIKTADSIMQKVNEAFNGRESSPNISLCGISILQHQFTKAGNYLEKARQLGLKKYEALTTSFDVDFELGRYTNATLYIKQLKPYADYGYFFRKSKLDHLNGQMDSAVQSMLTSASKAESSVYLKNVALANAADLYIHAGKLQQAYDLYKECIKVNSADFHSITGMGWIALVHDKNDTLAQQLFEFVHSKNKLPDPLFKLYQMAQQRGDSAATVNYARRFVDLATDTIYGNMYNKYVIELYAGILHDPAKAVTIAKRELLNRSTAQTNAWYAWSLFTDNKKEEAYQVYEQSVSGKPLEGLELYWMGKLMQGIGKGYNAKEFFKAAYKNKYDLSPAMVVDLETVISR